MMSENGEETKAYEFIPVTPNTGRRAGGLIMYLIPGILLVSTVLCSWPEKPSGFAMLLVSVIFGLWLIILAIRNFFKPATGFKFPPDTIVVFSGLILIAQGANSFLKVPGFQFSHILILTGIAYVFRGVMLPESKSKQGFYISEKEILYKRSAIIKSGPVSKDGISSLGIEKKKLVVHYSSGDIKSLNLSGAKNTSEAKNALSEFLKV